MTPQATIGRLGRWMALAYLGFAIVVGAVDIIFVLRHYTRFPFGDHWIWLDRLYKKGLLATLYSQFNEHRYVVPGFFYFADHRYFGSTNTFLVVLLVLFQCGCIILAIHPLWRNQEIPQPVRYVFAGFVTITMLWFIQAEDFSYPYQICFLCCNLGILATLHLFARFVERSTQSRPVLRLGIGMLACGLWATFSNGHGLLIWPVLLAVGLLVRLPVRWSLSILLVMLCALGIYFFHYETPPLHASPLESLHQPLRVLQYTILMIGLPFFGAGTQDISLSSHVAAYLASVSGILLAIVLVLRFARSTSAQKSRDQIIYCSLMVLCLGSCIITALGRSRFPLSQALTGRYAPVPLLFWISLAALITVPICRLQFRGGLGRIVWCAMLMGASLAIVSTQVPEGISMAGRERAQAAAALSITVGVPDQARIEEELTLRLNRMLLVDREATRFLGHSMFWRPDAALLGVPLHTLAMAPANACIGVVDTSQGSRLLGWAWDTEHGREVSGILVVDDTNVIRGLGITGVARLDVAAAFSNFQMRSAGWIAYSQVSSGVTVFAHLSDGTVCAIGQPRVVQPVPTSAPAAHLLNKHPVATAITITAGMKLRVSTSQLKKALETNKTGIRYSDSRRREAGVSFQPSTMIGTSAAAVKRKG